MGDKSASLPDKSCASIGDCAAVIERITALEAERAQLRIMFEQAPGFVAILKGPSLVYEIVNQAYYQVVGHRPLIGKTVLEALPELEEQGYIALLNQTFITGEPFVGRELPVRFQQTPNGPMIDIWIDLLYQPLFGADGKVSGIFVQGHDVTEQKRAKEALKESNERYQFALEGARDGIWDWDTRNHAVTYCPRWKRILGFADLEFPDDYKEWLERIHPEDRNTVIDRVMQALKEGSALDIEYRLRCKDGTYKWVLSRGTVVSRDESGRPVRFTGTMSDISEKKASEELVWRHASFDSLTGLPNRRLFRDRLEQELRRAHRSSIEVALLFIDLDHFKEVNDLLGHDAGDQLLLQVAERLSSCVRDTDTVARLGGDEFTVILTDLHDHPHIEHLAQKIIQALGKPFQLKNEIAHISASVGITLYPTDATSSEELIRNADQAMYAAKEGGRNHFRFFTKAMQKEVQHRARLIRDLRKALASNQLEVHFQPIVNLRSQEICKAEALLRWKHPRLGLVGPAQFIPLAEESGLIHEIGDWVLSESARWADRWSIARRAPFEISVNRSPVQFLPSTPADWVALLEAMKLSTRCIAVEITEGVLLNASENVAKTLDRYRDAGIQVALDDFGTGYSSLAYLKRFHIDYIKIDQSFVQDIEFNEGSRAIAESTIVMAHRLGLKVIAEGIEKPEQEAILRVAGCDFGQGFLFSRALPAPEFELLFQSGSLPAERA